MLGDEPAAVVEGDDLVAFLGRVARRPVGAQLQRHRAGRVRHRAHRRRDRRRTAGARRSGERLRRGRLRDRGARGNHRIGRVRRAVDVHDADSRRTHAPAVQVAHHVGLGDAPLRARAVHALQIDSVLLRHVAHHGAGALVAVAALRLLLLRGRRGSIGLRRRRRSCLRRRRGGLRRRLGRGRRLRGGGLARVVEAGQSAAHLHHRAFLSDYFDQHAGGGRRDLRVRLVGGDFDQRLIALDALAGLRQPLHHGALDDGFTQRGHRDGRRGHGRPRLAPWKRCVNERRAARTLD